VVDAEIGNVYEVLLILIVMMFVSGDIEYVAFVLKLVDGVAK